MAIGTSAQVLAINDGSSFLYHLQVNRLAAFEHLGHSTPTALSSLGLEFKAVVIIWVQQFGDWHSQEAAQAALARRQLYVAMTRAQEQLYVIGSGKVALLDELRESDCLDLKTELKSLPV